MWGCGSLKITYHILLWCYACTDTFEWNQFFMHFVPSFIVSSTIATAISSSVASAIVYEVTLFFPTCTLQPPHLLHCQSPKSCHHCSVLHMQTPTLHFLSFFSCPFFTSLILIHQHWYHLVTREKCAGKVMTRRGFQKFSLMKMWRLLVLPMPKTADNGGFTWRKNKCPPRPRSLPTKSLPHSSEAALTLCGCWPIDNAEK